MVVSGNPALMTSDLAEETLPEDFAAFTKLERLKVKGSSLVTLPEDIGSLQALQRLLGRA